MSLKLQLLMGFQIDDDAKIPTTKILTKWRPNILKPDNKGSITEINGIKPAPSPASEAIDNHPITPVAKESAQPLPVGAG